MLHYVPQSPAPTPAPLVPARRGQQVIGAFPAAGGTLAGDSGLTAYLSGSAGRCCVPAGAVVTLPGGDGQQAVTVSRPAGSGLAGLPTLTG